MGGPGTYPILRSRASRVELDAGEGLAATARARPSALAEPIASARNFSRRDVYHRGGSRRDAGKPMTVNLTRIYTKLGDGGETHLGDMSRVSKLHPRVEAYGTVDELNSVLGLALAQPGLPPRPREWLSRVQNDLLDLGADLCVPSDRTDGGASEAPSADTGERADASPSSGERDRLRISPEYTEWLERACDEVNAKLPPLHSFVIPGGSPAAAHLHVCRTVCRRAERRALAVTGSNPEVVRYLNRLSDFLFILARAVNEGSEELWEPGAHGASALGAGAPGARP
jgi:cob(I)alamin adenosyltransferase